MHTFDAVLTDLSYTHPIFLNLAEDGEEFDRPILVSFSRKQSHESVMNLTASRNEDPKYGGRHFDLILRSLATGKRKHQQTKTYDK